MVYLRGNGCTSDCKQTAPLASPNATVVQSRRHEWRSALAEKQTQNRNSVERKDEQQNTLSSNNPDDLLNRLTHNLLESSLKRLSAPKDFRKPLAQQTRIQSIDEHFECSGQDNDFSLSNGQTTIRNIGIYYSYTKADNFVSENNNHAKFTLADGKGTQMHHLTRRSSNGKLESIEEVNEIESLKTGTEKRECALQEALDFKIEEETDIALCTAESNLTDRVKRLVMPTNTYFRSSEVNPTQEVLNLSRTKLLKERLKRQITRNAEYGNQANLPHVPNAVLSDTTKVALDPWACKSLERNHKIHEISFKRLKNFGALTLNENRMISTKSPNGRRSSLSIFKPRGLQFKRVSEGQRKHNDSLFKTDRSHNCQRRFPMIQPTGPKRLSTSLADNMIPRPHDESVTDNNTRLHGLDTKPFKRLVSFTTSDTINSKATKKTTYKCFIPYQKMVSHSSRIVGCKSTKDQSHTGLTQAYNREQSLLSKLNLKTPTNRHFEGPTTGSDIADEICSIGTQKTYEVRQSITKGSCIFKRQADQPYKLTPYASKLIADTISRRFQKHRLIKDPTNVYQDLMKRIRPITDDFIKRNTKRKSRKGSIDMHKCDFDL